MRLVLLALSLIAPLILTLLCLSEIFSKDRNKKTYGVSIYGAIYSQERWADFLFILILILTFTFKGFSAALDNDGFGYFFMIVSILTTTFFSLICLWNWWADKKSSNE